MLQSPRVAVETIAPPPSPWLTIWLSPRQTIRRIVGAEVRPGWWPVVILVALGQITGNLRFDAPGAVNVSQSVMPMTLVALQVVFGVLVGPFLLAIVGGWFGGDADPADIREAIVWSYVPLAIGGLCTITVVFASLRGPLGTTALLLVPFVLAAVVGVIWSTVAQVITLAEVQRFSILRSIACVLIVAIPVLLLRLL